MAFIQSRVTATMFAAITLCAGPLMAEEWGTIRGQILVTGQLPERTLVYRQGEVFRRSEGEFVAKEDYYAEEIVVDPESGGLANVFIYLRSKPEQIHPELVEPPGESVTVRLQQCRFVPHCLFVRVGQELDVINEDPISNHAHEHPLRNHASCGLLPPRAGDVFTLTYREAERLPMKVTSDFFEWMDGRWLILDHPYAAVSDETGKWEIHNLPAGTHEFVVYHETFLYIRKTLEVTVVGGEATVLPPITIDTAVLKEREVRIRR
ncbi:MAG: hypothetical protein KDA85_01845 [Planctomycetaceae bacterium]|nr:hypothetical protein [Planctomycetaceae bacterium]